jgi:hypothetical protein
MEAKPCPLCNSSNLRIGPGGISCKSCGLWYGDGSRAMDRWRELRRDKYAVIPDDLSWIVEIWNHRVADAGQKG